MDLRNLSLCVLLVVLSSACASYTPKATPFRLPQAYTNLQEHQGLNAAAFTWQNEEEAKSAFGFNIIRAGLLPVQVVFDNQSAQTYLINPSQTFLVNDRSELFPVLDNQTAYDRVSRATDFQEAVKGVAKGAFWGSAAGALIGAAIGVAAGRSAGEYAMRGAVTGGAAGVLLGASQGAGDTELARQISEDLANRTLRNNPIKPKEIASGIIFFPAEAGQPGQLRLQLKEKDTQEVFNLNFPL